MNSNLYNKVWDFPEDMRKHMKICFAKVKNADSNIEGFNRNKRLQSLTTIGYPEIKRIKNFFDNFKGNPTDAPFILNGENKMRDFVNSTLSGARQSISTSQQTRRDTGMIDIDSITQVPNANVNLSHKTEKKTPIQKYDLAVTESLKRINEIIKNI
jgi:hypothetical protein